MGLSRRIGRRLLAAGIAATVAGFIPYAARAEQVGGIRAAEITIAGYDLLSPTDANPTGGASLTGNTSLPGDSITMGSAPGSLGITYQLLGDADLNGIVNGTDFGILAANFNKGVTGWDQGDFDYTNIVNGIDFGDLAANFNAGPSNSDSLAAIEGFAQANGLEADVAAAVPEPASTASIALVGILALAVVPRRLVGRRA
jgi:hypothetical protein